MQVALYRSHHNLPFGHEPSNLDAMFNPLNMRDWPTPWGNDLFPLYQHPFWPILMGLYLLDLPALGHMALPVEEGQFGSCKRTWIQITTVSPRSNEHGTPIVRDGRTGSLLVHPLWAKDLGTEVYMPHHLLPDSLVEELAERSETEKIGFWRQFFLDKLKESRAEALERTVTAEANARKATIAYALFPEL